jgi:hypothetical protein
MDSKIDLDAIIEKHKDHHSSSHKSVRIMMREAIHQALVLASENATATAHENPVDYGTGDMG